MMTIDMPFLLPDPYSYPNDYYQFSVPTEMPPPVFDITCAESTEITEKVATFKKLKYVEDDRRITIRWQLISYK